MDISAVSQNFQQSLANAQAEMTDSLNAVNHSPSIDNMLDLHTASVKLEIDVKVLDKAYEVYAEMFDALLEIGSDDVE